MDTLAGKFACILSSEIQYINLNLGPIRLGNLFIKIYTCTIPKFEVDPQQSQNLFRKLKNSFVRPAPSSEVAGKKRNKKQLEFIKEQVFPSPRFRLLCGKHLGGEIISVRNGWKKKRGGWLSLVRLAVKFSPYYFKFRGLP